MEELNLYPLVFLSVPKENFIKKERFGLGNSLIYKQIVMFVPPYYQNHSSNTPFS